MSVAPLTASEFVRLVDGGKLYDDLDLLRNDVAAKAPFGFYLVLGFRLDDKGNAGFYVAPPQILDRRDVGAWRLTLTAVPLAEHWPPWLQHATAIAPFD